MRESIKEYCKQVPKGDDIVFLTENSDDFASKDKKTFHPDLIEDCVNAGIDQEHIQLVTGVYKYVENEIIGRFEELQERWMKYEYEKDIFMAYRGPDRFLCGGLQ